MAASFANPAFLKSGFQLSVKTALASGDYVIRVFVRQTSSQTYAVVADVPVTVIGVTQRYRGLLHWSGSAIQRDCLGLRDESRPEG